MDVNGQLLALQTQTAVSGYFQRFSTHLKDQINASYFFQVTFSALQA
jgi:hypothetical protein